MKVRNNYLNYISIESAKFDNNKIAFKDTPNLKLCTSHFKNFISSLSLSSKGPASYLFNLSKNWLGVAESTSVSLDYAFGVPIQFDHSQK